MSKTNNNKPFVIGVAGGSGSGKSTVTREVLASIGPEMATVVIQDDYYCDQTPMSAQERRKTNYDHPQAFDWPLMVQHVQALCRGEPIEVDGLRGPSHLRQQCSEGAVVLRGID